MNNKQKIARNQLFVIIAMAVLAIVMFGAFMSQHVPNSAEPEKVSVSEKQDLSKETPVNSGEFYEVEFNLKPNFASSIEETTSTK